MPREAKLFVSSSGSRVRGFFKFRANIPPRWIKNARNSRKRIEPEIVKALRSVKSIQRNRPRALVALKNANKQSLQGTLAALANGHRVPCGI
jgi:hypothetical protein